jgi:creatinine amidohydrolase/Fe(II)-dependent formamide hydrolase-like protein
MDSLVRFIAETVITAMSVFCLEVLIYGFLRAHQRHASS